MRTFSLELGLVLPEFSFADNVHQLCDYYLPGFPITVRLKTLVSLSKRLIWDIANRFWCGGQHIGLSIPHAREFLKHPGVSFNLFYPILSGKKGAKFMKDARAAGRNIYAWTVNDEQTMRYTTIFRSLPQATSAGI